MTIRIYVRCSTQSQSNSQLGTLAQQDKCIEYIMNNYPNQMFKIYEDSGYSGSLDVYKRPQLSQLMSDLKTGDILMAYDTSRIARDTLIWINIEMSCKREGVDIVFATGCNEQSLETQLIRRIMSQVNEYALNKMKERTVVALNEKKKQGYKLGSAPYGYKHSIDRKSYVVHNEEYDLILVAYELLKDGKSYTSIAKILNDEGYTTRRGKEWKKTSVHKTLIKAINNEGLSI